MQIAIAAYSSVPRDLDRHVRRAEELLDALAELCGRPTLILGGYRGLMKIIVDLALRRGFSVLLVLPRDYEGVDEPKGAVIVRTGMDSKARSVVLVRSAEGLIVFGGASGTLLEALIAYGLGKPVVFLTDSGLPSDAFEKAYPEGILDERIGRLIWYARGPREAAEKICSLVRQGVRSSP